MKKQSDRVVNAENENGSGYDEYETVKRTTLIPLGIFAAIVAIGAIVKICQIYFKPPDDTKNAIDALLGFSTLIAIVVQSFIIQRQWQVMKVQTQLTRDSLTMIQRPYVFLSQTNFLFHHDPDKGEYWYSFYFVLINSGNTPTKNLSVQIGYYFEKDPLPNDFTYNFSDEPESFVIAPRGNITLSGLILTEDDLSAVQKGSKHFYVWVKCTYFDFFEDTPIHTMKFCCSIGRVMGNLKNPGGEVINIPFPFYGNYNMAD